MSDYSEGLVSHYCHDD